MTSGSIANSTCPSDFPPVVVLWLICVTGSHYTVHSSHPPLRVLPTWPGDAADAGAVLCVLPADQGRLYQGRHLRRRGAARHCRTAFHRRRLAPIHPDPQVSSTLKQLAIM